MSLFQRKSKRVIGLDISSTSVKLVELSRSADGYRVESFAVRSLPAGAVIEKNINDVDAVADTIRQAINSSRFKTKDAVVAVAGSAVITKVIDMPAGLSDEALESQITIEADQYIPFPLDEVAIDFEVQDHDTKDPERVKVLLAACRRENIALRTDVLEEAGLVPKIVDIEAYAIERAFPHILDDKSERGQLVAIVDIGATVTTLSVLLDNQTVYTREQLFGGNNLTEEIQRRYGLTQAEAEAEKIRGGLPDDYKDDVLAPFKDNVLQQITRSLQFFYSSGNYHQVGHIFLAGGVANIDGLSSLVMSHLDIDTSIANPFTNMPCSSKINESTLSVVAPSLIIAAGLAMRSVT